MGFFGASTAWQDLCASNSQVACTTSLPDTLRQSTLSPTNPNENPRIQRRATAQPLAQFVAIPQRNSAVAQAHATGCYSLKQIAQAFDLHYATISRIVKAAETGQLHAE
jgi:hypothetical protein